MVKTIHTLTIHDYSLFEKTGDVKYLLTGRAHFKSRALSQIEPLLAEITKGLSSEQNEDQTLQKEFHRLKSVYRIQYLLTLYQAAYNLLINKMRIDVWRAAIGKGKPSNYLNLIEYVDKIKEATGIEIRPDTWDDDMIALYNEIELWTDKYKQNFLNQVPGEGMTFFQIVLGVFAALQFPINDQISMSDFFLMKQEAEKLSKRLEAKADGR
ncbi:hypothetical protein D4R99_04615 [bacterium]|nr:MAG: hypothetical protein D4R99_04615 [bacterium]